MLRYHLVLGLSVVPLLIASTASFATDAQPTNSECARLAARFKDADRDQSRSGNSVEADYFATEAKSDCETGHVNAGARAYHEALNELSNTATSH